MPRKKKLKELKQTDGKAEPVKPTTLDQIWGNTGLTKYGTSDVEEYKEYIKGLNRTDIHNHALEVGIIPIDNMEILFSRLEREFIRHVSSFQAPGKTEQKQKKISKEVAKILSEGI